MAWKGARGHSPPEVESGEYGAGLRGRRGPRLGMGLREYDMFRLGHPARGGRKDLPKANVDGRFYPGQQNDVGADGPFDQHFSSARGWGRWERAMPGNGSPGRRRHTAPSCQCLVMRGWSQHLALGEKEGGLAEVTVAEKQRRMAQNDTRGMTQGVSKVGVQGGGANPRAYRETYRALSAARRLVRKGCSVGKGTEEGRGGGYSMGDGMSQRSGVSICGPRRRGSAGEGPGESQREPTGRRLARTVRWGPGGREGGT